MHGPRAKRTKTVTVRVAPETLTAAEMVAVATCRTVSSLMEFALLRFIDANYPDARKPGAKIVITTDNA